MTVVEKILRSMTPKFAYILSSIEESIYIDQLSVDAEFVVGARAENAK